MTIRKDLEKRFFDCGCACAQNDRAGKDLKGDEEGFGRHLIHRKRSPFSFSGDANPFVLEAISHSREIASRGRQVKMLRKEGEARAVG